ncbi:MAG: efflux RND transporter periplasmic adaptor subunit [Gemmatimonadaceae bacterium]
MTAVGTSVRSRWRARWYALSPQARRAMVAGAVLVAVGGAVWAAVAAGRDEERGTAVTPRGDNMAGMEGMAGMDMSPDGSVRLTSDQIRQFGITFGTVDVRTLESEVRTVGSVTFDETRIAQVAPKFGGFVERLHVNFTGQPVARGQPLLDVYSPELVAAQQELLVARRLERTLDESSVPGVPRGSTDLLAAARRRLELWDISEAQINDVLQTGRVRRTLTLFTPVSGVVVQKNVVEGQAITPGQPLYTIADLYHVWVDVQLREADAGYVRPGAGADLEFAAVPGRVFKGRVEYIYPVLDTVVRAVRARVAVTNAEGLLKPGMYATVRLRAPQRSALTVPSSAVVRTGERNIVFVDMGGGQLMPHDVELGRSAGEYTEVLAGVEPGQRVVTSAQFLLDSESNLGEVMRAMMGQMGSGDMGNMKDMPGMEMKGMEGMDKGADMRNMPNMPGMKTPRAPTSPRR